MEEVSFYQVYHRLRAIHRQRVHEKFSKIGLSKGQPKIISYLERHDGCIQRELAQNCHVRASTVTNLLMRMENEGFIRREACKNDRRILKVYLTAKGRAIAKEIERINQEVDEIAFADFSPTQKQETLAALVRLCDNLETGGGEDV